MPRAGPAAREHDLQRVGDADAAEQKPEQPSRREREPEHALDIRVGRRRPLGVPPGRLEARRDAARRVRWPARADAALVPAWAALGEEAPALGDTLLANGTPVVVAGFYDFVDGLPLVRTAGVVVAPAAFRQIVRGGVTETVALEVPPARLAALADALGAARPGAAVVTSEDLAAALSSVVRGLFALVLALTSLALLAGTVLIANGVGLAMVERRRELGGLKAVGYSAGQVLRTVVLENAALGAVAGSAGVGAAALALVVLRRFATVTVRVYPGVSLALVAVAVALAAGSALLVAWRPVRARPLEVLRSE